MPGLIGQSIARYTILEQIGEGGMATVYKARDTRLERNVALKIIRRGAFPPEQVERTLKRFEREANALARLTHPNIVPVIDYGEHEGSPFLVMPFLPGGTLKKILGRPMHWKQAVHMLLPIAQALGFAHQHNIIHRDVKPSNILLTENDQPMLSDFGIAKILDLEEGNTITGIGVGIGTPEYMSPEQGMGKTVTAASDVYSLGVVLFELVTGRKPFTADTPWSVVDKHVHDPLPLPRSLVPGLPEQAELILLKALAKKPEDRYTDMSGFITALERSLKAQPVVETKIPPPVAMEVDPSLTIAEPETRQEPPHIAAQEAAPTVVLPFPLYPAVNRQKGLKPPASKRKNWKILLISAALGLVCLLAAGGLLVLTLVLRRQAPLTIPPIETRIETLTRLRTLTVTASFTPMHTFTFSPSYTSTAVGGGSGRIAFSSDRDGNLEIYVMNPGGSGLTRLTNANGHDYDPGWSPDGSKIAFMSWRNGNPEIYVMNADGSKQVRLTNDPQDDWNPDWSPDGRKIVFESDRDGTSQIYVMDADGSGVTRLTQAPGANYGPDWSPNGRMIAFTSDRDGNWEIYTMNADGSEPRNLTNNPGDDHYPSWSPDGKLVAFSSSRDGNWDIYLMNADGSGLTRLTGDPGNDDYPAWSPDGKLITFTSERDGNWEIYTMNADGSGQRNLSNAPGIDWFSAWSP